MKKIGLVLGMISIMFAAIGQTANGTITGYVYLSDSTTAASYAKVWIDYNGDVLGVVTDLEGKFKISSVQPGTYNLHAEALLEGKITISGVEVHSEDLVRQNLYLPGHTFKVVDVGVPALIPTENVKKIPLSDIKHSLNIQDPVQMIVSTASDISKNEQGQMIIRGSRPGDVVYFVDGVKQRDMQSVPGVAINSISVYTGGVPAKYGDTMGGVVILNTKGYFDLYYAWKASQ